MGDIECVVDGCDYSADSVKSVEGHISGRTDEEHAGNGMMYREELVEQKENLVNRAKEAVGVEGEESEEEPPETVDSEGEESTPEVGEEASASMLGPAAAGVGVVGSFGRSFVCEGEGPSRGQVLAVLVLAFLLYSMLTGDASSSEGEEQEESEPDYGGSTPTDAFEQGGGLRG